MYFQLMDILNLKVIKEWSNVHEFKETLYIELCFSEVICAAYHWVFEKGVYK